MTRAAQRWELRPSGSRRWRAHVAGGARPLGGIDGVRLDFVVGARQWVDIDTLAEATLRGLADAGAVDLALLDAVVVTKAAAGAPSATVTPTSAGALRRRPPPGPTLLTTDTDARPRPGDVESKRRWREQIRQAWGDRAELTAPSWVDVALHGRGSLLSTLEVTLDALEPVLGRDPRGRAWQEFFPNDDRIGWLRLRRTARDPALRLTIGRIGAS